MSHVITRFPEIKIPLGSSLAITVMNTHTVTLCGFSNSLCEAAGSKVQFSLLTFLPPRLHHLVDDGAQLVDLALHHVSFLEGGTSFTLRLNHSPSCLYYIAVLPTALCQFATLHHLEEYGRRSEHAHARRSARQENISWSQSHEPGGRRTNKHTHTDTHQIEHGSSIARSLPGASFLSPHEGLHINI